MHLLPKYSFKYFNLLNMLFERKCVRQELFVGGNVKNCGIGFITSPPKTGSCQTHFLFKRILGKTRKATQFQYWTICQNKEENKIAPNSEIVENLNVRRNRFRNRNSGSIFCHKYNYKHHPCTVKTRNTLRPELKWLKFSPEND